ncbi:universal stress protein [Geomonas sp. RF6]|uniref:universal stress protein n=1 Tax=Geomonas sp. RF6 TaxID=2897342 RepID=UPI001E30E307|nr:universal stress protein [Geomonas sp. RF6]UFS70920.1 universal stress protein [Geomonas sp. RF6]
MGSVQKILVVSRASHSCRHAVDCGISMAKLYGAKLHVLHIVSEPVDMEALNAPEFISEGKYKTYVTLRQEAKEELDKTLRREIEAGLPIKIVAGDDGGVADIVKTVKEEEIDLVIMLGQEEGRLEHLLFGGENDELIRRMPCSILLVKKEPEPVSW